ncbi:3-deoxy-D-manno-octulosonic acid transferase [Mucilaginibacter myungsuensis]|uniref:3-deoxy-D-manno-octulosonic acid transferase n=1 Tax=Mucilaginibacter myungsuensis TaxID=649104 RepID=A0A929PVH3_9SPHI|nr:glycosyltransferase N-terminal domain-containing protein [Mucilaginibacter myungsuensis]MBE9661011.1 3-deoxy-D-manno-octulosonic acid transferase [Mucilaginibacter myungsuensis]MDN3597155.1 glycosyltransferase N-terminal domain-containing protein [Mucilaginibacter myungsuensis]
MLLLYNILIRIYFVFVFFASFFNKKAFLWIKGRKKQVIGSATDSIWFHFASLGEFEQGRPVLEALRAAYPGKPVIITFFSPSGYEVRKHTPLADAVHYLPLDTPSNARDLIRIIKPQIAVFTKYEYWYHYFAELQRQSIPLYIVSGIFRPQQVFFKWYGDINRKMLGMVSHFFVQDDASEKLLRTLNITNVTVAGDTRFDRVWANSQAPKPMPELVAFKAGKKLFIGGSTWPKDEELIASLFDAYPDRKFIIAPHEIDEENIQAVLKRLSGKAIRFTQLMNYRDIASYQVLVIDNMGILSSVYQYGDVAHIGGGFGVGIHNTLEAAAFGLPVIFGPNYERFKEARDLVAIGAGISIADEASFKQAADLFMTDDNYRQQAGEKARQYVADNNGATDRVVRQISKALSA